MVKTHLESELRKIIDRLHQVRRLAISIEDADEIIGDGNLARLLGAYQDSCLWMLSELGQVYSDLSLGDSGVARGAFTNDTRHLSLLRRSLRGA